jgi:hypothetical protein
MIDESLRTHGLSGDLGWNDTDEAPMSGLHSALLVVATSAYFGAVWLLSGLPPLPLLASRVRRHREINADSESAHQANGRSHQA